MHESGEFVLYGFLGFVHCSLGSDFVLLEEMVLPDKGGEPTDVLV
jgi:hypothetical protein